MVNMETIRELQAYGYILFTIFLAVILYSYLYHLYKDEKTGARNYEKYSNIALHDNINDAPVEAISPLNKEKD